MFSPNSSISSLENDILSLDQRVFNCMNLRDNKKEEILTNQKEAAMRRRRRQFKTGIIDDSNHDISTQEVLFRKPEPSLDFCSGIYHENFDKSIERNQRINSIQISNDISPFKKDRKDTLCDDQSSNGFRKRLPHMYENSLDDKVFNDSSESVNNFFESKKSMTTEQQHMNNGNVVASYIKDTSPIPSKEQVQTRDKNGLKRSPSSLLQMINHEMQTANAKASDNFSSMSLPSSVAEIEQHLNCDEDNHTQDPMMKSSNECFSLLQQVNWEDTSDVKKILMEPVPKECGIVKCYMKRYRGKSRLCPEYRVYLDDGDHFLMTSKKRAKKTSSNYLISIGRNDYCKSSTNIIGKLRANFLGTEFQIYDTGKNPKHLDAFFDEKNYDEPRSELGAVLYSSNILGNRGPRKMQVCINRVSENGVSVKQWKPMKKEDEMLECFKTKNDMARKHLLCYENRQPKWNEDIGSYVLNFDKRVSLASVKNFQLIDPTNPDGKILMQFGKKGQDEFIMDVQYPMSLFQAFAVSLSSCDSKLGVD